MFEKFRRASAASRLREEQLYQQVVDELSKGLRRDGLWAKALENANGVETKAKGLYIRYRVQSIKDEVEMFDAMREEESNLSAQIADPEARARSFGLSDEDIEYLGKPIEAARYADKYKVNEVSLRQAISRGRIRGVKCGGVLWVQDKKLT